MTEPAPTTHSPEQPPPNMDTTDDLNVDLDMGLDGTTDDRPSDPNLESTIPEPREPTKKDISLRDFVSKMDDYAPIIPDAVTSHHLLLAGLSPTTTPLPLQRLLALATQKLIADIAADAYQYSRMRSSNTGAGAPSTAAMAAAGVPPDPSAGGGGGGGGKGGGGKEGGKGGSAGHVLGVQRAGYGGGGGGGGQGGKAVLTMEDLGCAVGEYGVNVRRGEFYR